MTETVTIRRELLERIIQFRWIADDLEVKDCRKELRALLSAPSPAGVDGLEVRAYERKWSSDNIKPEKRVNENGRKEWPFKFKLIPVTQRPCLPDDEQLCRLSDAQAIIDGLRGEVERLQFSLEVAKTDELSAAVYAETESIKHSLWDTEKERDQQAQRIGELDGLLLRVQVSLSLDDTEWGYSGAEKYKLLADIRAAMSAGKESDQ